jgi:FtsP/CotA-like multicopper oxidase with cupredoxin domain
MNTITCFPIKKIMLGLAMLIIAINARAQFPGSGQVPLNPGSVLKFVDPLPHFAYPGTRVDATTAWTPVTIEIMSNDQQAISTGTVLPNGTVVSPTNGLTHVWAYRISNGTDTFGPNWPAFTIEARRGSPLNVMYLNNLEESYDAVNLTVDQTLHWALMNHSMDPYTGDVPAVGHLHGGEVPSWSDGGPDSWYTPEGDMGGTGALTNVFYYPNTQEAATLWFHDHALGLTRLNVYAGLAGFYLLRDEGEDLLHLPGWSGDNTVQEIDPLTNLPHGAAYLPEIEMAIQDRMFDQNGELYFPAGPGIAPNPMIHPWWNPEFVGDIITVNGKTWPYLSVAPRKYRIRLLNGSNARFYELWLENSATEIRGPIIWQVGTDGGLLDSPVPIDPTIGIEQKLVIAPGERADLVIDFSSVPNPDPLAPYAVWTLRNSARTPFPFGGTVSPTTTGRIMQFMVNGQMNGADNSVITGRATPLEKLANFNNGTPAVPVARTRQLTLNEVMGMGGPLEALVNNTKWNGYSTRPYGDFVADPSGLSTTMYSEIVNEGETEVWQVINLTGDAHPIHLHLVQFQLLSRQNFNVNRYNRKYTQAFQAAGFAGVQDGWGPPLHYLTGNDTSGTNWTPYLGGNPNVDPYLQGMPMPALPNEQGWKDTFIMLPGQVTTVIARWAPTDANTTGTDYYEFDPSGGPGYVWHCHIIDHEDNEMMRPYAVNANGPVGRIDAPLYAGYHNSHPDGAFFARRDIEDNAASSLPRIFEVKQNYPNPFNARTEIAFELSEPNDVKLEIYSVTGQLVGSISDHFESGKNSINWDASEYSSGVYFYKFTVGDQSRIMKMTLIK